MLEASAHQHLKRLLRAEGLERWPHHLSLSRLVGRSLRRGDHTLIQLEPGCDPSWFIGLLVPLALSKVPLALVASPRLRQRLLQVELPRLQAVGLQLPCWEGPEAPPPERLWLLDHEALLEAWRSGRLGERQLVLPEAEALEPRLREALALVLTPAHWDSLRRSHPAAEGSVMALHERLSRRVLSHPGNPHCQVALQPEDEAPLRHLLQLLEPLPAPWPQWLQSHGDGWTSWAVINRELLHWQLHRQPLAPLEVLGDLFTGRGAVVLGALDGRAARGLGLQPQVTVRLADPHLGDPLPLYAPLRQPLPNGPCFGEHLLEHSRRLVLAQSGLSVILLDDEALRLDLTSALAAEFGSRVTHACTAPESNGVLCCSWDWWLEHQDRLPAPCQLIVGLLPIASLEDPLTAAKVARWRQQGRDWFRELLLPEALSRLQRALASLRRQGGRLAVLDGRLRSRSWGRQVLTALEPWISLRRLLPE
jgi:ATP-dependent DNA helicase DinG